MVHELLHFSVPNHGKLWKSLMRAHLGTLATTNASQRVCLFSSRLRRRLLEEQ
jgi:hypothetical protein